MINRRQLLVAATAGVAGTAIGLPFVMTHAQGIPTAREVFFDPDIPVLGNPNGDVTIVEFFDYQCPYCKLGHPGLMRTVEKDGNVRLVMKDFPIFGSVSVYAANLVLAASRTNDYAKAMNALMKTEGRLRKFDVDVTLKKAGLDPEALNAEFKKNSRHIDAIIVRNMAQATAFDLQGTPAFIIGRKIYPGLMNEKALTDAVAEARRA